MKLPLRQIDAFASEAFRGNPAAVVMLDAWLPDATLQAIAVENNLSETAFVVPGDGSDDAYRIRWFTPGAEVDLCGHATLASAHVLFDEGRVDGDTVRFETRESGPLVVTREGDRLVLDFPSRPASPAEPPEGLVDALGADPVEVLRARDHLLVYETEAEVRDLRPDFRRLAAADAFAVIVTAPGEADDVDFVSRFFAPQVGIDEDPVTGSAHCTLVPYWAARLGKTRLFARQVSPRGGDLWCEDRGERVSIAGHAVEYLRGEIEVPDPI